MLHPKNGMTTLKPTTFFEGDAWTAFEYLTNDEKADYDSLKTAMEGKLFRLPARVST